jgi:hypothetical protein
MRQFMHKTLPLALVGAACLSLATIGEAKAFTFTESANGDAGARLSTAADTTGFGAVGASSTIEGLITADDPTVNPDRNKADLFKILIASPGEFNATTEGRDPNRPDRQPYPIEDPFLYLFDITGQLIASDDDSAGSRQSSIVRFLAAGRYYLGITKYGHNPQFDSNVLTGWSGNLGQTSAGPTDANNVSAYRINLTHTPTPVPTPALLPGLVGMGLSLWRKQQKEGTMAEV